MSNNTRKCCLKRCSDCTLLTEDHERVEIKTVMPKSKSISGSKYLINWYQNGEAYFHKDCWMLILKSVRARSKKNEELNLLFEEKALVKEAAKTAEQFDSVDTISQEAKRVAAMIKASSHCIAFTGAGISTSAGIGDYRGKSGKWTEMDQDALDMDSLFESGESDEPKKKKLKTEKEEEKDEESEIEDGVPYENLRPTYTHEALSKMAEDGRLKFIISQNGDGLHGLSGVPYDKLAELHGNVFVERCEKCRMRYERDYYVMDDTASQYYEEIEDFGKTDIKKPKYADQCFRCGLTHRTGRKCNKKGCGGHLIDSIINFGDKLDGDIFDKAMDEADNCDLMLCMGTTLKVTPASELVERGQTPGPLRLVICNRQKTHMDKECVRKTKTGEARGSRVYGDCDKFFKHIMKHLMSAEDLKVWEEGRRVRMANYNSKRPNDEN